MREPDGKPVINEELRYWGPDPTATLILRDAADAARRELIRTAFNLRRYRVGTVAALADRIEAYRLADSAARRVREAQR